MSKRLVVLVALAAASLSPAALAAKSPARTVSSGLSGKPVTTKGSPTGSGRVSIKLDSKAGTACWAITVKGLDRTLSAHVHKGLPGKTGPVVIPLGSTFLKKGCVSLPAPVLVAVGKSPKLYYVDVHTRKYVNGSIRGQLHAGG